VRFRALSLDGKSNDVEHSHRAELIKVNEALNLDNVEGIQDS